jgi:crossover junction endodeoxyribonuclease RuvC
MAISPSRLSGKIILGVDPGTRVMGYGLLEVTGSTLKVLQYGVLKQKATDDHATKLKKIFDQTLTLINEYLPDELAIEAAFYGKSVQSMLKLGRAQGMVIAAAFARDIPYVEYAPKKVKHAVTGNGNASKEQVARTVVQILKLTGPAEKLDATDALSVALCHHYQKGDNARAGDSSWASFLTKNPGRAK